MRRLFLNGRPSNCDQVAAADDSPGPPVSALRSPKVSPADEAFRYHRGMIDQVFGILISLGLVGVGLTLGGLAVGMALRLARAYQAAVRSRSWPTTPGRITHSETVWVGARTRSPRPDIRYTYEVGAQTYVGQRIAFEYSHVYSREAAEQVLKQYPVGATPSVYYDPDQPAESTLKQSHVGLVSGLAVAVMLLLPMALCLAAGAIGFADTLTPP